MESLNSKAFCASGVENKSWAVQAQDMFLSQIPGLGVYQVLFGEGLRNDRAFLMGFIDSQEWKNEDTALNQKMAQSGARAIPQAMIEGAVVGKFFKALGRPLKDFLHRHFKQRPDKKDLSRNRPSSHPRLQKKI